MSDSELNRTASRWLINHSVEAAGPYLHVPVKIAPPCCRPRQAPGGPLSWRIAGQPGDALKAALQQGTWLDVRQIKAICAARGIDLPDSGSGKTGGVIKVDLLQALLRACFPEASDAALATLLKRQPQTQGSVCPQTDGEQEHAELLIRMTAALSTHEAEHFQDIRDHAVEQLEAQRELRKTQQKINQQREDAPPAEARGPAPSRAPGHVGPQQKAAQCKVKAPQEFVKLLPDVAGLYMHWEPKNRRVWVEFRGALLACCGVALLSGSCLGRNCIHLRSIAQSRSEDTHMLMAEWSTK